MEPQRRGEDKKNKSEVKQNKEETKAKIVPNL
jgi:hypothetical protein